MSKINALTELENILSAYLNFELTPKKDALWLKNMELLCNLFDNPQNAYKTIHVAGSKGKGSTSSFIASVLQEAGISTGLFTSPHVSDISERVRTPFEPFECEVYEKSLAIFTEKLPQINTLENNGGAKATWFELITLFAFICFREAGVEWAVIEVGLGGRLDSTNVLVPKACVITPIELEHTQFLGDTLEKVAFEKAGIIKKGIPIFSCNQTNEVKKVFLDKANDVTSTVTFLDELEHRNDLKDIFFSIDNTHLKLQGSIQKENAKLATLTLKTLFPKVSNEVLLQGLAKAFLPCRLEDFSVCIQKKTVFGIMDGAHTPNSLFLTLEAFYEAHGSSQCLLFACADDKDVDAMAKLVHDSQCAFSSITVTLPGNVKKGSIEKAQNAFTKFFSEEVLIIDKEYTKAIKNALETCATENKALLCVGSFYLCAELKNIIERI